eukprot:5157980-Lingulodinium_polyedra.AAC.2
MRVFAIRTRSAPDAQSAPETRPPNTDRGIHFAEFRRRHRHIRFVAEHFVAAGPSIRGAIHASHHACRFRSFAIASPARDLHGCYHPVRRPFPCCIRPSSATGRAFIFLDKPRSRGASLQRVPVRAKPRVTDTLRAAPTEKSGVRQAFVSQFRRL